MPTGEPKRVNQAGRNTNSAIPLLADSEMTMIDSPMSLMFPRHFHLHDLILFSEKPSKIDSVISLV